MSYILKALRKSQKERDLGQVPSISLDHGDEPAGPKRRWWPWILGLALLANLGVMAAYAWEYVIPQSDGSRQGGSQQQATLPTLPGPDLDESYEEPAIPQPRQEASPAPAAASEAADNSARAENLDAETAPDPLPLEEEVLAKAFQLTPLEPGGSDGPSASGPAEGTAETSAPRVRDDGKKPMDAGPKVRLLPPAPFDEASPGDTAGPPVPASNSQLAALQLTAPAPVSPLPPQPRRRPDSPALPHSPPASLTAAQVVESLPLVTPQPPLGEQAAALPAAAPREPAVGGSTIGRVEGEGQSLSGLPRYEELAESLRAEMPTIVLSVHVFDPDPNRRFARINRRKLREGDTIAQDLWLDSVTPQGVILRYADTRFIIGNF